MNQTEIHKSHPYPRNNDTVDYFHPIKKVMLPNGSMREFQDEAAFFFKQHDNPVVGYVITTPSKLKPIKSAFTKVKSSICVVVKDEVDFDMFAEMWQYPYTSNQESLDLTQCMTTVHFTRRASEAPTESHVHRNVYIPDGYLSGVIYHAAAAGFLAVVLCSLTRALLLVFPFDDGEIDGLQAAAMTSGNWCAHEAYDDATLDEAARKYGHLSKRMSEGWGIEVVSCFTEAEAKAFRDEYCDAAYTQT